LKIDPKMISASALLGIARYEMEITTARARLLNLRCIGNASDGNAELFLAKT